jgi:hypothetical protein
VGTGECLEAQGGSHLVGQVQHPPVLNMIQEPQVNLVWQLGRAGAGQRWLLGGGLGRKPGGAHME